MKIRAIPAIGKGRFFEKSGLILGCTYMEITPRPGQIEDKCLQFPAAEKPEKG